jgi:hypothetical protein
MRVILIFILTLLLVFTSYCLGIKFYLQETLIQDGVVYEIEELFLMSFFSLGLIIQLILVSPILLLYNKKIKRKWFLSLLTFILLPVLYVLYPFNINVNMSKNEAFIYIYIPYLSIMLISYFISLYIVKPSKLTY